MPDIIFIQARKKDLLKEKERLEADLSTIAKKKGKKFEVQYTDYGGKDEENAEEYIKYTRNLALDKSLEKLLSKTLIALKKIDDEIYGICERCGKSIPEGRLEAFPAAGSCMECESKDNPFKKLFSRLRTKK